MNSSANKLLFLIALLLLLASGNAYSRFDKACEIAKFDRETWGFNSRKAQVRLVKLEALRQEKVGSINPQKILDAYSGKIENLYLLNDRGSPILNAAGKIQKNMEVDHVVPLKLMHLLGGCHWSLEKKSAFANDPVNLRFTTKSLNASKGSNGPSGWLPPTNKARLRYIKLWRDVAAKYPLVPKHHALWGANVLRAMKSSNPKLFSRTVRIIRVGGRAVVAIGILDVTYVISKKALEYYEQQYAKEDEFKFTLILNTRKKQLDAQKY